MLAVHGNYIYHVKTISHDGFEKYVVRGSTHIDAKIQNNFQYTIIFRLFFNKETM